MGSYFFRSETQNAEARFPNEAKPESKIGKKYPKMGYGLYITGSTVSRLRQIGKFLSDFQNASQLQFLILHIHAFL